MLRMWTLYQSYIVQIARISRRYIKQYRFLRAIFINKNLVFGNLKRFKNYLVVDRMDFEKNITKSYVMNKSSENRQLVNNWSYTFLLQCFCSIEETAVTNNNNRERFNFLNRNSKESANIRTSYVLYSCQLLHASPSPKIFNVRTRTFFLLTQDFTHERASRQKYLSTHEYRIVILPLI